MKKAEMENWTNLVMGAWVFVSPWIFLQEASRFGASWNMWVVGAIIAGAAVLAIRNMKPWEEWVTMLLGLWLIISPWVFGYTSEIGLLWNSIVTGLVVAVSAGLALPVAWRLEEQH